MKKILLITLLLTGAVTTQAESIMFINSLNKEVSVTIETDRAEFNASIAKGRIKNLPYKGTVISISSSASGYKSLKRDFTSDLARKFLRTIYNIQTSADKPKGISIAAINRRSES